MKMKDEASPTQWVHDTYQPTNQGYELARVYRHHHGHNDYVIRITIHRNSYLHQSRAVAEVLTPALTWTEVARAWPATWHEQTPSHNYMTGALPSPDVPESVNQLSDSLLEQVLAVLEMLPW